MRLRTREIAEATGGRLVGADVEVDGVGIDTRELAAGSLFVPIEAERDGHDFIVEAVDRGAAAYLTARGAEAHGRPDAVAVVEVRDTAAALAAIGGLARRQLGEAQVVGITGSVGKTTTKDLLAAVLATTFATSASVRSFNNELGVPLTLANAPDGTEVVVVEMGARGRGHIEELCAIARPTIGVVTSVEGVHTELFGDVGEVAAAKGELVESLPASGVAVLNADNPLVAAMAGRTRARVQRVSLADPTDVWAEHIVVGDDLRPSFRLRTPRGERDVTLSVRGEHNVINGLLAAAAGLAVGVSLDSVAEGLAAAPLSPWRMELATSPSGARVLNDAYNAGPASTAAALRALAAIDARRRVAVLGVMAELGDEGERAHREVGDLASRLGIQVIAVDAPAYGPGAVHVSGIDAALDELTRAGRLGPDDAVLVKASRVAGLEHLAAALLHSSF
jgi:UDP-N-acetylmuramoyl-tripeptide--D-alanyl-D-alanine ligase